MLRHLKQFFGLSKRAVFAFSLILVLLVAIAIFIPNSAQAQDFAGGIYNGLLKLISEMFLGLGKFCISFAIFALKFFIAVAQYNNYLDAPTVMIGWIMVRDVANMFFVVALLMIAFGTILGLENYQWNKTLIKLVLSAILINFSNLICGIFIDIAHVFTITFVSAIAGTAGGNLINMFKLEQIYKITTGGASPQIANIGMDLLVGSFASFIFSLLAALIIGAYALIMLVRMVALWVLIILSPLAFIFQVIPQTQQYAKQWWDYFGKYVIAAPVMVFFLWLAFATLGTGDIVSTLQLKLGENELAEITQQNATLEAAGTAPAEQSLSLSAVTTWTNMASFLIPLVLLVVGTKMVEQTGVFGGGMLAKAVDFGKKVATIASGYTAGRWMAGKMGEGAKAAGKGLGRGLLYLTPYEQIKRRVKREITGFHAWRLDTGYRPKTQKIWDEKAKEWREEFVRDEAGNLVYEKHKRGALQRTAHFFAARDVRSEKKLEKTENFAKNRRDLLRSRLKGVPTYFLQREGEHVDALDRVEQGMLAAEKSRSESKTKEFQAVGRKLVTSSYRWKDGKLEDKKPTLDEQIASHEMRAERGEKSLEKGKEEAKKKFVTGGFKFGPVSVILGRDETGADIIHQINLMSHDADAAKAVVEGAKDKDLGKQFEEGVKEFDEAIKKLKEQGRDKVFEIAAQMQNPAAKAMFAKQVAGYTKETYTDTVLTDLKDQAETMHSWGVRGFDTPATAMKKNAKKCAEAWEGAEKEKAATMGTDAFQHLLSVALKPGGKLDHGQRGTLMGLTEFLVRNGWQDDMLSRMVNKVREWSDGKIINEAEKEEVKNMAQWMSDNDWGEFKKDDKGNVTGIKEITNESSEKRTNDLQRFFGLGMDTNLFKSENAVLLHQKIMSKKEGKKVDYEDAAKDLAERAKTNKTDEFKADYQEYGVKKLGWSPERINNQFKTFENTFVTGAKTAQEAMQSYIQRMVDHSQEQEYLTELKVVGLKTTHLDDAGHTFFNQRRGYAHGLLSIDAMDNMQTDWVKQEGGKRMRDLKSHALGYMEEDTGTLHRLDGARVASTYSGIDSRQKIESQDVRIQRHLLKNAADEEFVKDKVTGELVVGGDQSVLVKDKFKGVKEAAALDTARDWAVLLNNGGEKALLGFLGIHSGVGYDQGVKGKFRLKLFGKNITDAGQLTKWINTTMKNTDAKYKDKADQREIENVSVEALMKTVVASAELEPAEGKKKKKNKPSGLVDQYGRPLNQEEVPEESNNQEDYDEEEERS